MFSDFADFALGCGHANFEWPPIPAGLTPADRQTELQRRAAELDWQPAEGDDALIENLKISGAFVAPQEQEHGTRTKNK